MKNAFSKGIKLTLFVALIELISIIVMPRAYAITDNQNSQYTSHKDQTSGPIKFVIEDYMGTCIDSGNAATESGTALMTKLSNDSEIAKAAYFFGVQLGYAEGLGSDEGSHFYTESRSLEYLLQDLSGTLSDSQTDGHQRADALKDAHPEWSTITVPSSFVIYKGEPIDDSQKFVVWKVNPFSAKKEYNCDTPNGLNHSLVKNGDTIIYDISWENGTGNMTITDVLSKGLKYIPGSSNKGDPTVTNNSDGTTTLVWTTTEEEGTLTYSVKVEAPDPCSMNINKVQNNASMTVDNKPYQLAELDNPLPSKCYAPMPNDGYNGKKVNVGDDIKYQITLTNVKNEVVTAYVTDIISRGLTYNKDATVNTGQITAIDNQEIDSNGNNKLKFTISLPAKSTVVLTYSAKVNSEAAVKVLNNASVRYDNERLINLNQLENPIYVPNAPITPDTPNEPETVISTPDTASNVLILGVASGLALVGVGGYFIYKKLKKK